MKKILTAALAAVALVVGLIAPAQAATNTTVTLYSTSTYGWASGYHQVLIGPPYQDMNITITISGNSGCNSSSDEYRIKLTDMYNDAQVTDFWFSVKGGTSGTATWTYDIGTAPYHNYFFPDEYQNIWWWVGPQTGCHLSFRVWDQA